ncbi:MFS transporter [Streptomyces sp. NPDC015127]|uniref:MFS transporter n=1 Tax=Streptomyces sp. NPDC015127 TaxID=3364939 RepID=UPI0036F6BAB0
MTDTAASPIAVRTSPARRRELTAATVGSVVESFDWNMYAILAPYLAAELFGEDGGLVQAYGGFAVGFFARPLGGLLIGRFSDRHGRRAGLTLSMSVIALASLGLALIPSAAVIGVGAALLAVAARLVQGLAYGGETPTVAAYVTETAPPRSRFLYSAVSYGGIVLGSLLSFGALAVLHAVLGRQGLDEGGWRWGFVIAAVLGLAALWVRRSAPESEDFEEERRLRRTTARQDSGSPVREALLGHPWSMLSLFLFCVGGTVAFYCGLVYLPVYADGVGALGKEAASAFMPVVFVVTFAAMLMAGVAADRFGGLRTMRAACLALAGCTLPLMLGLRSGALPFEFVALAFGVLLAPVLMGNNVVLGLLFPTAVRAVGLGVGTALTIAVFGGTFPMLAEWLQGRGWGGAVPFYVTLCALGPVAATFTATRVPDFARAMRSTRTSRTSRQETTDVPS